MYNVTLNVSADEGEFGFDEVYSMGNPLVGAWLIVDEGNTSVLWFLPDGTYMVAEDGPNDDPTGQDGMEHGTWSWVSHTGAFSSTTTVDTNGQWGLSHAGTGLTIAVNGNAMVLTVGDAGTYNATRIGGLGNSIVGGWYTLEAGEAGGTVAFAFMANGQYFMAQDGSSILDPSGQDGMERGTYTWNAANGAFSGTAAVDTNGEWGMSHGSPSMLLLGLNGGPGNDAIGGSDGAEVLFGYEGDDTLDGLGGNDTIHGGTGFDMAVFTGNRAENTVAAGPAAGSIVVTGPDGVDLLTGIEALEFEDGVFLVSGGSAGNDTLAGTEGDDIISGGGGNDTIGGGGGDDALSGDAGHDQLDGGAGNDVLDGGTGNDTMRGGEGNDTYFVDSLGDSVIEPDSIAPLQPGGPGAQVGIGAGTDRIVASLTQTLGNAIENLTLLAGAGNIGGTGNAMGNELVGNEGNNVLRGGAGNDTLDGGAGLDTAVYAGNRSEHTVSFVSIDARASGDGVDMFTGIERLRFDDKSLALDLDGNAGAVAQILALVFGHPAVSNEAYAGIGLGLIDGGMPFAQLMQLAMSVAGLDTDQEVVTTLYTNIFGEGPDPETSSYFVGVLEAGYFTHATLGVMAANYMGLPPDAMSGLEYV